MNIHHAGDFKDRHVGEACFMVGAGPSLTYEMLDSLVGHNTIAMNNISLAYPHTKWRPKYYLNVARSPQYCDHWKACMRDSLIVAEHNFISALHVGYVLGFAAEDIDVSFMSCTSLPFWRREVHVEISRYGTSMFSALQLASYMGFRFMYLIGCDLGYPNSIDPETGFDSAHFTNNYLGDLKRELIKGRRTLEADEERALVSHYIAAIETRYRGIWIKTCTRGKTEAIYPYIPFEEALREAAVRAERSV